MCVSRTTRLLKVTSEQKNVPLWIHFLVFFQMRAFERNRNTSETEREHTLADEKCPPPSTEESSFLTGLNSASRRWGCLSPAVSLLDQSDRCTIVTFQVLGGSQPTGRGMSLEVGWFMITEGWAGGQFRKSWATGRQAAGATPQQHRCRLPSHGCWSPKPCKSPPQVDDRGQVADLTEPWFPQI